MIDDPMTVASFKAGLRFTIRDDPLERRFHILEVRWDYVNQDWCYPRPVERGNKYGLRVFVLKGA